MSKHENPWKDAKDYYWGREMTMWVLKAKPSDPVRYYGELHVGDSYYASFGSNLPFSWLVAVSGFIRKRWL